MADGGGSAGTPSLADIGNICCNSSLVSNSCSDRGSAQTQQGFAGTQVVTEHVVGEVVQQVLLAFSQQQQATTDQTHAVVASRPRATDWN